MVEIRKTEPEQNFNFMILRVTTIGILLLNLFLCNCGNNGDDANVNISTGNIHAPININLIHGTLPVARVLVNGTMSLDMLIDTGSTDDVRSSRNICKPKRPGEYFKYLF